MSIVGYFDSPADESPCFDPGIGVPCPFCLLPLASPLKTISLCVPGSSRSYFYRAHKACYEGASPDEICDLETGILEKP